MKKFVGPIAIMLCALIVAGVFCGAIIYNREDNNDDETGTIDETLSSISADKAVERPLCVLVIGKDKVSALADVIMLITFDKNKKKSCILQIPRDTYAEYGSDYFKINGALKYLGGEGMCDFLEETMGIEIDGYISLDLEGFRVLVDAIGGVEITVEKALKYSDPAQGLYIDLAAGRQTLDGKQSEMLVRYRSGYARGDLDRLDIQKRFLAAFFLRVKEKITPFSVYSIANKVLPYIETDIDTGELISLCLNVMVVDSSSVSIATLPGEDAISQISGASFYVLSAPSAQELLTEYFLIDEDGFDKSGCFLHPSLENFKKIYQKRIENKVFSVDELK